MNRSTPLTVAGTLGAAAIAGAFVFGAALGAPAPAAAHNYLVSSTPAEGETLTTLPEQFVITTNDDLLDLGGDAGGFALQVQDADGRYYGDGCVVIDGPSMTSVAALGEAGDYQLTWQVVSIDGHTVSGQFPFSWAPTDTDAVSEGSATAPVCGEATELEAEPEPEASEEPIAPAPEESEDADAVSADLLWLGAAIAAVVIAAGATMLIVSRRKK